MIIRLLTFVFAMVFCSAAQAATYIDNGGLGNSTASQFVLIEGKIEIGLTDRFLRYIEENQVEGSQLFLNSPGGNLGEALRLGRAIRELGWTTHVGGSVGFERNEDGHLGMIIWPDFPSQGVCESACAYVFMGGVNRHLSPDAKLGLHRFRAPGQSISGDAAQAISGQLISFMAEMGIDARVFVLASNETSTSMYHVSRAEAEEYDLVTPSGFSDFFLEPYNGGIVAASKRQDGVRDNDYVEQITAFCRGDQQKLLYYAGTHGLITGYGAGMGLEIDNQEYDLPADAVTVQVTESGAYITATLTSDLANALVGAQNIQTWFNFPSVAGGFYPVKLNTSELDRRMLGSAFRFCLE